MRPISSLVLRTREGEGGDHTNADRAATPDVRSETSFRRVAYSPDAERRLDRRDAGLC